MGSGSRILQLRTLEGTARAEGPQRAGSALGPSVPPCGGSPSAQAPLSAAAQSPRPPSAQAPAGRRLSDPCSAFWGSRTVKEGRTRDRDLGVGRREAGGSHLGLMRLSFTGPSYTGVVEVGSPRRGLAPPLAPGGPYEEVHGPWGTPLLQPSRRQGQATRARNRLVPSGAPPSRPRKGVLLGHGSGSLAARGLTEVPPTHSRSPRVPTQTPHFRHAGSPGDARGPRQRPLSSYDPRARRRAGGRPLMVKEALGTAAAGTPGACANWRPRGQWGPAGWEGGWPNWAFVWGRRPRVPVAALGLAAGAERSAGWEPWRGGRVRREAACGGRLRSPARPRPPGRAAPWCPQAARCPVAPLLCAL